MSQYRNTGWRAECTTQVLSWFSTTITFPITILSPWRRIGQRWEPPPAPLPGPGPNPGVAHDAPLVHSQLNPSGLAPCAKSLNEEFSFLICGALEETYRGEFTHRFPRGTSFGCNDSSLNTVICTRA